MQQFRILKLLRTLASIATFSVLLAGPLGCSRESPEQALRLQVGAMQNAIEARDAGDVHALLAEDFIGNEGLDRRGTRQLAVATFLRHRDVAAHFGPVQVDMRAQGDATARFTVLATGGSGDLLPESGQVFNVETGWRLVDGQWRLLNASWTPRL